MKSHVPYNPRLKERARFLRNNSALSEVLLWNHLKQKQMKGFDFHRQKPIDSFIVDFYCPALMLAIEIDGDSHIFREACDVSRQRRLEKMGIQMLRFDDLDVKFHMEAVLKSIEQWIEEHSKYPAKASAL